MGRILLAGSQTGAWRDWLKAHREERPLLCLDPASAELGFPGRLALFEGDRCTAWRFIGSLSVLRSPHSFVEAVAGLLPLAGPDAICELFPFRTSPLRHQMAMQCIRLVAPDRTIFERRCALRRTLDGGVAEEVDVPSPPSTAVLSGHRKARWLQLVEQTDRHSIEIRKVVVEGARLGSGSPLPLEDLRAMGFQAPLYGEAQGSAVLIVSDAPVDELEISRVLDSAHAAKAIVVPSTAYDGLLCALGRAGGEEFGYGYVESINFGMGIMNVRSTAVAPAPVATIKLGGLRIDAEGREGPELKPWDA